MASVTPIQPPLTALSEDSMNVPARQTVPSRLRAESCDARLSRRGADRRITRWIGQWAHDQVTAQGLPAYAGIRYVSRLSSDWTCWAVFDRTPLAELERRPILRGDEAMASVASRFSLRVY